MVYLDTFDELKVDELFFQWLKVWHIDTLLVESFFDCVVGIDCPIY